MININSEEFADIVVSYILDMSRDDSILPDNERFRKFITIMKDRGIKTEAFNVFVDMDAETRSKYRQIKSSIDGISDYVDVRITRYTTHGMTRESVRFDRELCKKIFRTIKEVRFNNPSKVLNETRIDKIIDYCIKQKEEQKDG